MRVLFRPDGLIRRPRQAAVTVTVRVASTSDVTQCRKLMLMVYFPGAGGWSRKSNFSAAPDLMMLVRSGWPAIEGCTAGPVGFGVIQNGRPSWAISSAILAGLPAASVILVSVGK